MIVTPFQKKFFVSIRVAIFSCTRPQYFCRRMTIFFITTASQQLTFMIIHFMKSFLKSRLMNTLRFSSSIPWSSHFFFNFSCEIAGMHTDMICCSLHNLGIGYVISVICCPGLGRGLSSVKHAYGTHLGCHWGRPKASERSLDPPAKNKIGFPVILFKF